MYFSEKIFSKKIIEYFDSILIYIINPYIAGFIIYKFCYSDEGNSFLNIIARFISKIDIIYSVRYILLFAGWLLFIEFAIRIFEFFYFKLEGKRIRIRHFITYMFLLQSLFFVVFFIVVINIDFSVNTDNVDIIVFAYAIIAVVTKVIVTLKNDILLFYNQKNNDELINNDNQRIIKIKNK